MLDSARAKLDRANHHLTQLKSMIDNGRQQRRADGISFIHEGQTDELVIRARMPRDLFIPYAIVAGEVIHQTRSTANSLAKVASTNWYSMNHRATCFSPMYSTNLNRQGLTDQPSLHF